MGDQKAKIKRFLGRVVRGHDIDDDLDIFATGYINSMFAMELITFLESEFGVQIEDSDLDIKNFATVNRIADLIDRKISASKVPSIGLPPGP
ncbi:MAG TPA: acyl carrier protein [Blastocatellia bacterium]|nr:acyl carrier protein [Blastocatellia bacterium]